MLAMPKKNLIKIKNAAQLAICILHEEEEAENETVNNFN
jgi:hypothetical protein